MCYVGKLGAIGYCLRCGKTRIRWDPVTDISACESCGWNNEEEAIRNKKKDERQMEYLLSALRNNDNSV